MNTNYIADPSREDKIKKFIKASKDERNIKYLESIFSRLAGGTKIENLKPFDMVSLIQLYAAKNLSFLEPDENEIISYLLNIIETVNLAIPRPKLLEYLDEVIELYKYIISKE